MHCDFVRLLYNAFGAAERLGYGSQGAPFDKLRATLGFGVQPLRGIELSIDVGGTMSQSLVQIYVHIVFSTKNREPFLSDRAFRERTHAYLHGICENQGSPSVKIGGVADHVHILCRLSKTLDVSTLVRELKRDSSKWVKENNSTLADFYWQQGYGAFSISPSHVEGLIGYIVNQEEHHRRESFQDEFRRLCKKYGVAIDERYVWD